MRRLVVLALPLLALATACGGSSSSGFTDFAPDYVGTYTGSETVSITWYVTGQTTTATYTTGFQIAAGAAASDLVITACSLTGHASSPSYFITFPNTCTVPDPATGCNYTYGLDSGAGTKIGTGLTLTISGVATAACPTGTTSGTSTVIWNMTQL